jgi:CheY-like chemotaxis protein
LRVSVQDTGIGIPPKQIPELFQDFHQAHNSKHYGGTGLGLAISRRLVQAMHGTLGVTSEPGRGSTFWLKLPLAEPNDPLQIDQATGPHDPQTDGLRPGTRVLVADDNRVNQRIARALLERLGCQVDVVTNGREAIEMWQNLPYDAILMDCLMPEMDGFEATNAIRQCGTPRSHIPIIAMTANAMPGDRERCSEAGMTDYLAKPLRSEDLAAKLIKNLRPIG